MIENLTNINKIVEDEKLDICIVSYGGSGTNELSNILEKNGYKCRTNIWDKILCHCPEPININIPIIYIYRNLIDAFFSIKRRGYNLWSTNQKKLSNNLNTELSDGNLIKLMLNQFENWKNSNLNNILFLHYNDLFENSIKEKLENFLKTPILHGFPLEYKEPNTKYDINNIHPKLKQIFFNNIYKIKETQT